MLQTSARTHLKRQPALRGWLIVVVGLGSAYQACTPGRVDLLTGASGGEASFDTGGRGPTIESAGGSENLDTSTGATAGQGGQGGNDSPPDKPKDPRPYDPNDESVP